MVVEQALEGLARGRQHEAVDWETLGAADYHHVREVLRTDRVTYIQYYHYSVLFRQATVRNQIKSFYFQRAVFQALLKRYSIDSLCTVL